MGRTTQLACAPQLIDNTSDTVGCANVVMPPLTVQPGLGFMSVLWFVDLRNYSNSSVLADVVCRSIAALILDFSVACFA